MIEVTGLCRYPLTGARAESLETADVAYGGILGDRMLVLYDPSIPAGESNRVGQKQQRKLAQVTAKFMDMGQTHKWFEVTVPGQETEEMPFWGCEPDVTVNEFGVETPCISAMSYHGEYITDFLEAPHLKLAQKTIFWALGMEDVPPEDRKVRPVHIVSEASVRELQERAGSTGFGFDRFRPNVVIDGDIEAFAENTWTGRQLHIGGATLEIVKPTPRCPVPGFDQQTGQNMKDVPKLYRGLDKDNKNTALFGVYAVPEESLEPLVSIGDEVVLD